jgi:hypothetical protein
MIKRNIKTIICYVLCFIYLFKFFTRLKLYGLKALHTKHCFSLYYSFINSSYVLTARNASSLRPFQQASNSFSCISFIRGDPAACSVY